MRHATASDPIAVTIALRHHNGMRRRPDRYDYGFQVLGGVLTYLFLLFASQQGWSWLFSIGALIAVAIPVGLALGWVKSRLQARLRNGS
ncbi:MAG: hypothetical protein EOO81_08220 [Oxalobacteraceae bacterium]|nr:MAG: hypothetical protein EOO81_08220 [Oxalobacteraceae bacterium]